MDLFRDAEIQLYCQCTNGSGCKIQSCLLASIVKHCKNGGQMVAYPRLILLVLKMLVVFCCCTEAMSKCRVSMRDSVNFAQPKTTGFCTVI